MPYYVLTMFKQSTLRAWSSGEVQFSGRGDVDRPLRRFQGDRGSRSGWSAAVSGCQSVWRSRRCKEAAVMGWGWGCGVTQAAAGWHWRHSCHPSPHRRPSRPWTQLASCRRARQRPRRRRRQCYGWRPWHRSRGTHSTANYTEWLTFDLAFRWAKVRSKYRLRPKLRWTLV